MSNRLTNRPVSTNQPLVTTIRPHDLQQLQHFAEIGRLSASLLHEISNPLTAAMLWLEQYDNQQSPNIKQVRRNIRLLQRYVEAARQQVRHESYYRDFKIHPELEQVKTILAPLARSTGVKLLFMPAQGYRLYGDPVKFQQIIANLVNNAIDAYRDNPRKTLKKVVNVTVSNRQDYLVIEVTDHGCGIPRDHLCQLFQPFYSTKSDVGLGIGLFAIKRYIEADFQGNISVTSSIRHGTRFTVRLRQKPVVSPVVVAA